MPVFLDERVIGFVACSAHQVDMGGAAPGSQKVHGVTEAFQEGLRILPVRFVREGKIDEDILRIVLGNVRMPDKVRGDLLAQHTANLDRLRAPGEDVQRPTVSRGRARLRRPSSTAPRPTMRAALAEVPAGTYSFEDHLDDYGPGTPPIKWRSTSPLTARARSSSTSRARPIPVPAALNSYINYTRAYAVFAIKVLLQRPRAADRRQHAADQAQGARGLFFNPKFPAPVGRARRSCRSASSTPSTARSPRRCPHRAMGAFSHWSNPNIGGIDDRTGRPFVMYDVPSPATAGATARTASRRMSPS